MAKKKKQKPVWRLVGYDTFSNEWYDLDGKYHSEEAAEKAAKKRMGELEKSQPSVSSGGQSGIQDRVYIEGPDGQKHRFIYV